MHIDEIPLRLIYLLLEEKSTRARHLSHAFLSVLFSLSHSHHRLSRVSTPRAEVALSSFKSSSRRQGHCDIIRRDECVYQLH